MEPAREHARHHAVQRLGWFVNLLRSTVFVLSEISPQNNIRIKGRKVFYDRSKSIVLCMSTCLKNMNFFKLISNNDVLAAL